MASKNPEKKSLDLLINVISENDWLDLIYFTPKKIEVRIQGLISKSTDYSTQVEELSTVTLDHVKNVEQLIGN